MAPTGPERSSRWVLPTCCIPCACTLRRTVLLQSAERILQRNRPKRKTQLGRTYRAAHQLPDRLGMSSVYPLIIPRTLQPAEVWGIVLGNVWEKILTRFRKNCLCRQMMQKPGRRWPVGRRTLSVTTGQCAGTTLAYVARGSAKAAAEIRTARILYSAPPIWGYKSCALFVLQSIHPKTHSADLASPRFLRIWRE